MYQGTVDDYLSEKKAIMKEKEELLLKYVALKDFIPFFENIEKTTQKFKFINEMKERCGKEEFQNYLYQYCFIQQGRMDEMSKRIENMSATIDQKDITNRGLEMN